MCIRNRIGRDCGRPFSGQRRTCLVLLTAMIGACSESEDRPLAVFGTYCSEDGECSSGLCIETDGATTAEQATYRRCSSSCSADRPCPSGYCGDDGACILGPPAVSIARIGVLHRDPSENLAAGVVGWSSILGRALLADVERNERLGIETVEEEWSIEPDDVAAHAESLIESGDNVIIADSSDFLEELRVVAGRRTDVRFLVASSFDYGTNMGSFAGRLYQATYVLGTIAGSVTTTNTVAIVGPRATPEMVLSANAFARGALALNPNTAIIVHWTGSWRSAAQPPGEFIAIDLLVGELGADVVYNLTDTHAPLIYL